MLINFIIYKKAFLTYGMHAVWQNIPVELLINYFKDVTIIDIISGIGVMPLLLGVLGFTFGMFKGKRQYIYLLSAMILADLLLLLLRLINFPVGIMFLGILLAIISSIAFDTFSAYFAMTKFSDYRKFLRIALVLIVMLSLAFPAYDKARSTIHETISGDEVNALHWISENTKPDSVVLSSIEEGNYVTAIANRRNVADTFFLLAPDRFEDISTLFKTESLVQATQLLKKYDVDYIYFSDKSKQIYNTTDLVYTRDEACFEETYNNTKTRIFEVLC